MTGFLQRLRGALGIGVIWGVLWAGIGFALVLTIGLFDPEDIGPGEGPGRAAAIMGALGFLSGLAFAGLFSLAERRRTIRELSLGRVAVWGVLGGVAIPLLLGTDGSMGWMSGALGGTFAAASVAAARRGALPRVEPVDLLD